MVCSPARLTANRKNSLKSTGPSVESRARTRANSLKHGLTGAGVVLPCEDIAAVEHRFESLDRECDPKTERQRILVRRASYLSIRLLRCEQYDVAMLSYRVRHAVELFHQQRTDELNRAIGRLSNEPELVVPHLRRDPDGLDWLIEQWEAFRKALGEGDGLAFGITQVAMMVNLMGERFDSGFKPRGVKLHEAFGGYFGNLDPADRDAVPDEAKPEWARGLLLAAIDRELAEVKGVREVFDVADLKADQDEAIHRALFDPSKEAILARRYEAATERSLLKTFRELDALATAEVEAAPTAMEPVIEQEPAPKGRGSLASFFPINKTASESEGTRPISPPERPSRAEIAALVSRLESEKAISPPRIE